MDNGKKPVPITVPSAYVHPYQRTDKNGKTWDKAIVGMPTGTKVNGIDITGYSMDQFMSKYNKKDKLEGKSTITFAVSPDEPVEIFKGKGKERESFKVNPWDLTKGIKAAREAYAAEHPRTTDAPVQDTPVQDAPEIDMGDFETVDLPQGEAEYGVVDQSPEVGADEPELELTV